MTQDIKFNNLKRELKRGIDINKKIESEINKKRNSLIDTWKIECRLSELSHNYKKGDTVVLPSGQMAEIRRLIRRKHYELFVVCSGLIGNIGTKQIFHEKDILCHAMDLVISREHIKYKSHGWRGDI